MKLPTWRGETAPVEQEKKKPSKDAWKASLRTRSFRVGGIQCGGGGHCGGDRRGGQSAGQRAACRGDAV